MNFIKVQGAMDVGVDMHDLQGDMDDFQGDRDDL